MSNDISCKATYNIMRLRNTCLKDTSWKQRTCINKMNTYCVECRKYTENIDSEMFRTKNNRLVMQSKCPVCRTKKSRFIKNQEAKGLMSNLGIKTPLSKLLLLNILF